MGRKRKEIDIEKLKKLCAIQCTRDEVCFFFDISDETLNTRLREAGYGSFKSFFEKYSADGKISLRRIQFKLAEKSSAMAIWLGKQYLGQREPIQAIATDDDAELLKEVARKLRANK